MSVLYIPQTTGQPGVNTSLSGTVGVRMSMCSTYLGESVVENHMSSDYRVKARAQICCFALFLQLSYTTFL